jgi:hypothetical protein
MSETLQERLRSVGCELIRPQLLRDPVTRRIIAIADVPKEPTLWNDEVKKWLSDVDFRAEPPWNRYLIVIVQGPMTAEVRRGAAAFSHRVDDCRRFAILSDELALAPEHLPFFPLAVPVPTETSGALDAASLLYEAGLPQPLVELLLESSTSLADLHRLAEDTL